MLTNYFCKWCNKKCHKRLMDTVCKIKPKFMAVLVFGKRKKKKYRNIWLQTISDFFQRDAFMFRTSDQIKKKNNHKYELFLCTFYFFILTSSKLSCKAKNWPFHLLRVPLKYLSWYLTIVNMMLTNLKGAEPIFVF